MKTVWKFEIHPDDIVEIELPYGAEPLSVQMQRDGAFGEHSCQMWVLCDPNSKFYSKRRFRVAGTGHPISEENLKFIDTFQTIMGLVFHVFEIL